MKNLAFLYITFDQKAQKISDRKICRIILTNRIGLMRLGEDIGP